MITKKLAYKSGFSKPDLDTNKTHNSQGSLQPWNDHEEQADPCRQTATNDRFERGPVQILGYPDRWGKVPYQFIFYFTEYASGFPMPLLAKVARLDLRQLIDCILLLCRDVRKLKFGAVHSKGSSTFCHL